MQSNEQNTPNQTSPPSNTRTVILGLGNSILSDDAVGILVARAARELLCDCCWVEIAENERGGMDVLDEIGPYERAVLIDGIKTGKNPPGTLLMLSPTELQPTRRLSGFHDLDLPTAIKLAQRLSLPIPKEINVLAVEIEDDINFSEECTPKVAAAVLSAAQVVASLAKDGSIPQGIKVKYT